MSYYTSAYCCVPRCTSRLVSLNKQNCNGEKLSFHHFPNEKVFITIPGRGRVNLRDEWKRRLQIGKKITNAMRVCSLHFKQSDYIVRGDESKKRRLKGNACPVMCIPFTSEQSNQRKKMLLVEREEFKDSRVDRRESHGNNNNSSLTTEDEEDKGSTSCLATCKIVNDKDEHICAQCSERMKMRYLLFHQQKSHYLCGDFCFQCFCDKQNLVCVLEPAKMMESIDTSIACEKAIEDGQGHLLSSGMKLCSEECKKSCQNHEEMELCAQCDQKIRDKVKCITWTSKVFCNEDCLDRYQTVHSHKCPNCQTVIEKASLGRFCLYTKTDIQDFCSLQCLEVFKEDPKVCKICGNFIFDSSKDYQSSEDKSFYCEKCIVTHGTSCKSSDLLSSQNGDMTGVGFRMMQEDIQESDDEGIEFPSNEALNSRCWTCNIDMLQKCRKNIVLQLRGASKRFCTKSCMNRFVLTDRKFPCFWCKEKKSITDMVERVDSINHVQLFCSLHCLSLFRVSLNATSSKDVTCDTCKHIAPAAYHLTMSDASVRNFCCYECVSEFQNQFEDIPEVPSVTSL